MQDRNPMITSINAESSRPTQQPVRIKTLSQPGGGHPHSEEGHLQKPTAKSHLAARDGNSPRRSGTGQGGSPFSQYCAGSSSQGNEARIRNTK